MASSAPRFSITTHLIVCQKSMHIAMRNTVIKHVIWRQKIGKVTRLFAIGP